METNNTERRYFQSPVNIERRAEAEAAKFGLIKGIAAKVGVKTDLGWCEEIIEPGAFDDVLNDDVRCLFNHCEDRILARSNKGKGTLKLSITADGDLAYEYTTPNRSYAIDLQDAIEAGDVTQSSFAFRVKEQSWVFAAEGSNVKDLRKIVKFEQLIDVSPVTYAAYEDTEVAKRSKETFSPKPENIETGGKEIEMMKLELDLENQK